MKQTIEWRCNKCGHEHSFKMTFGDFNRWTEHNHPYPCQKCDGTYKRFFSAAPAAHLTGGGWTGTTKGSEESQECDA